jgi:hypothetical protein
MRRPSFIRRGRLLQRMPATFVMAVLWRRQVFVGRDDSPKLLGSANANGYYFAKHNNREQAAGRPSENPALSAV